MSWYIAMWAYTDARNNVQLFTGEYLSEPTNEDVMEDAWAAIPDEYDFDQWYESLAQVGVVKVVCVSTTIDIIEED